MAAIRQSEHLAQATAERARKSPRGAVLLLGAGGPLGNALVAELTAGFGADGPLHVGASQAYAMGFAGVASFQPPRAWVGPGLAGAPRFSTVVLSLGAASAEAREKALLAPAPTDLLPIARWSHAQGASCLVVVMPHAQGRLPEALKHGLANLDEHAVMTLGFERVLFVRSPQPPQAKSGRPSPERLAHAMLSIFRFMVPQAEQAVRASAMAQFVANSIDALQTRSGGFVAAPAAVWRCAQASNRAAMKTAVEALWGAPTPQHANATP